jgi:hypothetical protein
VNKWWGEGGLQRQQSFLHFHSPLRFIRELLISSGARKSRNPIAFRFLPCLPFKFQDFRFVLKNLKFKTSLGVYRICYY